MYIHICTQTIKVHVNTYIYNVCACACACVCVRVCVCAEHRNCQTSLVSSGLLRASVPNFPLQISGPAVGLRRRLCGLKRSRLKDGEFHVVLNGSSKCGHGVERKMMGI